MPPIIGVTTRPRPVKSSAGTTDAHTIHRTYTDAVLRGGGVPVPLAPVPSPMVEDLLDRIDGLVLSGGGDVDPARYGGPSHDAIYGIDFDRDEFEIELALSAARRRLPLLGICRGLQVVNVALGGTLIGDIPSETGSADHTVIGHEVFNGHQHVRLDPTSRLARVVEATDIEVNSIHHQAVRDLAPGLHAVGWADDGIIEAVEHEDEAWPLLAVQWHPEYLDDASDPASIRLFSAHVSDAASHRAVAGSPDRA
jgi:putative glutamine amidotransferase